MIYFEKILEAYNKIFGLVIHNLPLYDRLPCDLWNQKVFFGNPISTKQVKVCLEKFKTIIPTLAKELNVDQQELTSSILNPVYKIQPYESFQITPEVRHLSGNFVGLRMKYNKAIHDELKRIFNKSSFYEYDFEKNLYIVNIDSILLEPIMEIVKELALSWDEDFELFLLDLTEKQNQSINVSIGENINVTLPFEKCIEDAWNYILLSS